MNRIMDIPGFKGVIPSKMEQLEERVILHVSMPKKEHICPDCKKKTIRVHRFLEGINNTSKVLKRNAYGFKKYEHYKAKVILTRVNRNIGCHFG